MAEKILLALSTFPDRETAQRISSQLVTEKFAACRRDPQPDWSTRPDRGRTKDRDREHHKVNDPVENVGRVIDELKRFLNSGADLAGNGNDERSRADENDRVNRRLVTRVQTREPIRQQMIPTGNHRQSRAAGHVDAG